MKIKRKPQVRYSGRCAVLKFRVTPELANKFYSFYQRFVVAEKSFLVKPSSFNDFFNYFIGVSVNNPLLTAKFLKGVLHEN